MKINLILVLLVFLLAFLFLPMGWGQSDAKYTKGANDALDSIMLLDLELKLNGDRKNWGEMTDIVRERLQLPMNSHPITTPEQTNETITISNGFFMATKIGWYQISSNSDTPVKYLSAKDQIKLSAASGKICKALGFHCWESIALTTDTVIRFERRRCKLCNEMEVKENGKWKRLQNDGSVARSAQNDY